MIDFTRFQAINLSCLIFVFSQVFCGVAFAQSSTTLIKTDEPVEFVEDFLLKVEASGVGASEELFTQMGLNSPQISSTISMLESQSGEVQDRWTSLIGADESAGVLTQVYAYSYLGNNVWIYYRLDFVRISDSDWALSNLILNTEHSQVISGGFSFLD